MPAVVLAVALAAVYLVVDPPSADLAAHTYRVGLFQRFGLLAWDNGWYGGHHLPGYSLLFPPLGAWLGIAATGALSLVAATAAFAATVRRWLSPGQAAAAASWFAVALAASLVSGRLPYALGVALGACATLAAARGAAAAAAPLGAATALASPVAGLFAVMLGVSWWWSGGRARAPLALAAGALVAGAVVLAAFPEGGSQPFVASAFWPALAMTLAGLAVARPGTLRTALGLYALLLAGAAAFASPIGGNAARLGALLGGPAAIALLWRRPALLALAAAPLAYGTLRPAMHDWQGAAGDRGASASYFAPLLGELRARDAGRPPARLEIPFTRVHWEAAWAAASVPLARGWERQLDRERNALFYDGTLGAASYRAWLEDNAVRWVAVSDLALDPAGEAEAALIASGLPYLREVWHSRHWRLLEVRRPEPLGALALGPDWFTTAGGLVRVRWSPHWAVVEGRGCVERGPRGWTLVTAARGASPLRIAIRVSPLGALSSGSRCR